MIGKYQLIQFIPSFPWNFIKVYTTLPIYQFSCVLLSYLVNFNSRQKWISKRLKTWITILCSKCNHCPGWHYNMMSHTSQFFIKSSYPFEKKDMIFIIATTKRISYGNSWGPHKSNIKTFSIFFKFCWLLQFSWTALAYYFDILLGKCLMRVFFYIKLVGFPFNYSWRSSSGPIF